MTRVIQKAGPANVLPTSTYKQHNKDNTVADTGGFPPLKIVRAPPNLFTDRVDDKITKSCT